MPWNNIRLPRRQFTFDHVQVSPADAAGCNAHQHLFISGFRHRQLRKLKWVLLNRRRRCQGPCLHRMSFDATDRWMQRSYDATVVEIISDYLWRSTPTSLRRASGPCPLEREE